MESTVRLRTAACVAIAVAAAALYWPAGSAWFFEDDLQWLAGTLTFHPSSLFVFSAHEHFYRPVIALYFWAATPLFGGSPVLFHWANIVLHAANGMMVLLLARAAGFRPRFAFFAALLFVSMPAYVEAIAWVSALAEPVATLFGGASVFALLQARQVGARRWKVLSIVFFVMAVMTHESAVVLLPLLFIADWAFPRGNQQYVGHDDSGWPRRVRRLVPFAIILVAYLLIDLSINRRSYLIEEGHYRLGLHAVENLLGYVVSLYVGKRNLPTFIGVGVVLTLLLLRGTPRVVFATGWLLLAILPFAFFTWGNASRYAYMPAVGLALLLAEALEWLDGRLGLVAKGPARAWITAAVAAFITIRFMTFTAEGVRNFSARTEPWRRISETVRLHHPHLPPGARVPLNADTVRGMKHRYLEALVQWEFRDPGLTVGVQP